MSPAAPYLLVIEDQPAVRQGLVAAVAEAFPGATVHEAPDCAAARARLGGEGAPSLVLVDLGLPDGSGLDLLKEARARHPEAKLVVTTVFDDDAHLFGALAAGADGYVLKESAPAVMRAALKRLADGEVVLSPSVARRILASFRVPAADGSNPSAPASAPGSSPGPASASGFAAASAPGAAPEPALTPRQVEVLGLVARGLRVAEVARVLGLSDQTVAGYVKDIYRKLDISSRAEAALEAAKRGLV